MVLSDLLCREVKIETARFDSRRWYVEGFKLHWFSTKEDAESALALATQITAIAEREIATSIREAIEKVLP